MELRLYLRMLQRSWWIVALVTLAAFNGALLVAVQATPQYRTSARYIIRPNEAQLTDQADIVRLLDSQNFVPTYAEIWNSERLYSQAGQALQLAPDTLALYQRSAVILPGSNVVELTVSGPNPSLAALLANTLGELAIAEANAQIRVYSVAPLDQALVPALPYSPQPARDAGLATAVGVAIGAILAIGREQLRVPLDALRRRMIIDGESSAFTRAHLQRTAEEELNRNRAGVVSLGVVHLFGLEDLYDSMPPLIRQRLLHQVTQTLRKELRGGDRVGRWGSSSFAVLLPATPASAASLTLARIQQALAVPVEIDRHGEQISLIPYVGLSTVTGDQPVGALASRAEEALAQARQTEQHLVAFGETLPV